MEYFTTGQAGGYMTDGAPESAYQPTQRLFGNYYESVPYQNLWPHPETLEWLVKATFCGQDMKIGVVRQEPFYD